MYKSAGLATLGAGSAGDAASLQSEGHCPPAVVLGRVALPASFQTGNQEDSRLALSWEEAVRGSSC